MVARIRPPTGNLPFRGTHPAVTIEDLPEPELRAIELLDEHALDVARREQLEKMTNASAPISAATNASTQLDVGAAGDPSAVAQSQYGALGPQNIQAYLDLAKGIIPPRPETDPALYSLMFFTKMAEEASKPGATAIGAGGAAGGALVDTLLEERKQERAEAIGTAGLGIQLASALAKPRTLKAGALRGEQARYMTEAEARKYFVNKGLSADSPNLQRLLDTVVPTDESMLGQPVVREDNFLEFIPVIKGNEIIDFNVSIATGGAKPRSADYYIKRMAELASGEGFAGATMESIPKVQQALDTLMTGVKTGIVESALLGIKQTYAEVMGQDYDPNITGLQDLESISFYLAPKMRPKGSGSTSDMEFKAYQKAIVAIQKTPLGNYVSLYTFKKAQENAARATQKELEILTGGGTAKHVNAAIEKLDKGIYEKYYGDMTDQAEFDAWFEALPRGALIYNSHGETGEKIMKSKQVWVVKGGPDTFR